MNRIHALNEESSEESEGEEDVPTVTKEAQEQNAFTQYNLALTLLHDKKYDDAARLLQELLDSSFLVKCTKPEGADALRQPVLMLKYSCLKNMGNILLKQGNLQSAIEYLLQASHLDATDVTLWYQIGTTAVEVVDYVLAVDAFLEGLHCSPRHWPCLDGAITVLYVVNDTVSCLHYVARALALDPDYIKGLALRDAILAEVPSTLDDFKAYHPDDDLGQLDAAYDRAEGQTYIKEAVAMKEKQRDAFQHLFEPRQLETMGFLRPLPRKTWLCVGESLIQLYKHMYDKDISFCSPINLTKVGAASEAEGGAESKEEEEKMDVEEGERRDEEEAKEEGEQKEKEPASLQHDDEAEADDPKGNRRRRRNSLSFLEQWIWSGKRRSARVRSTARKDADDNLGQALRALVPRSLMPCKSKDPSDLLKSNEDSQDTMELYKLFKDSEGGVGVAGPSAAAKREQLDRLVREEGYFSTDEEAAEVGAWLEAGGDFLPEILMEFCKSVCSKQGLVWPKGLSRVYLDAYALARKHCPHPCPFSSQVTSETLVADARITLLHGELLLDSVTQQASREFPCDELGQLLLVTGREPMEAEFLVRMHWLKGHVMLRLKQVDNAIDDFDAILHHVGRPDSEAVGDGCGGGLSVRLANCLHNEVVTSAVVDQLLATLTRNRALCEVPQLYQAGSYDALVLVLQETLKTPQIQPISEEESALIPDRQTQLAMLMETLQVLDRHQDCFYWGESCLHEALNKYLTSDDSEQQSWASTLESLLGGLLACIEAGGLSVMDTLSAGRLSRLVQNITHVLCQQLEAPDSAVTMPIESVAPWIIMHRVLERAEGKAASAAAPSASGGGGGGSDEEGDDEMPASLRILVTAHEFLARRSWCCSNEGALLLHMLDVAVPRLRDSSLSACRDQLSQALEQAVYCLYGHPGRKTKGRNTFLQEHGVPQIALTWQRSAQLVQLYQPDEMPEFDSYRVGCITADVEGLLKRILALVPPDCDLSATLAAVKSYIDGTADELPIVRTRFPRQMAAIYYLLADYNFKNNEWAGAVQYYLLDACLNPCRLDTWAGMALARGGQLEVKLNSCEPLDTEDDFLKRAAAAQRCYRRALDIDSKHSLLWIEYGSFVYTVHSFCCRLLKQENEGMSMQVFVMVEARKEEMLAAAVECFSTANKVWYGLDEDHGIQDERWLHHYMLGKAAEKTDSDPERFLSRYAESIEYLHKGGATYPRRISYNSPQNLAVEALEVYYRIHASILKYLESREGKGVSQPIRTLFEKYIEKARVSPFITKEGKENEEEAKKRPANDLVTVDEDHEVKRPRLETDSSILEDVIDTMEVLIERVLKTVGQPSPAKPTDIIEISDDDAAPVEKKAKRDNNAETEVHNAPKNANDQKLVKALKVDSSAMEVGVVEGDAKGNPSPDQVGNKDTAADESVDLKDAYVGEDAKLEGSQLTRGQICDIIGVNIPEEGRDEATRKEPGTVVNRRVSDHIEGRPNSNSYEDNFLKFISSVNDSDCMDVDVLSDQEVEVGTSKGPEVVEYLDETNGKVVTILVEPKKEDVDEPMSKLDKMLSKVDEAITRADKNVAKDSKSDGNVDKDSKPDGNADKDSKPDENADKDLRRSSQESTTTTATTTTTTTLTTSSEEDESSDSEDSSDSSDSSESESSEAAEADQSAETVVEVKTAVEVKEKEEVTEVEVPPHLARVKEENIVKDNTDLAEACLRALEECVLRFPQHYKSLYRLGHHYFRSRQHRDVAKCRELLLGTYKCGSVAGRPHGSVIQGLFAERKNSNFFNGVWRIPMSDIDRPGSFASHMSRCVQLLMEVLTELKDHALLLELCVQLRKTPDSDKKYLRDSEREQLSRQALSLCLRAARSKVNALGSAGGAALVVDMYRAYQRSLKHLPDKEKAFAGLLQDAYGRHRKIASPPLDEAIKFSVQELATLRSATLSSPTTTPTASPLIPPYNPYACLPPKQTKSPAAHKSQQHYPHVPRSRGRPPNAPRVAGATGTGFEYPKASNSGSWKAASAAAQAANALSQQRQQYASMLAQNMAAGMNAAMPFYGMHSLFSDVGLANLASANYGMAAAGLGGGNLNMANINAANLNMTGLGSLDQQITALNMLNYQVQMGNYQSELMRHYGTPQHSAAPSPSSIKDRPNISITPVSTPKPASKPVEKSSAAALQEKMLLAAAAGSSSQAGSKSTKNFPALASASKSDVNSPKTAAQIAAAQLAEIASRSNKGGKGNSAALGRPPAAASSSKVMPIHATLLKDNQVIGSGVSITQIQQQGKAATDTAKQSAAYRKPHLGDVPSSSSSRAQPPNIPDLNLSLKGLGASLTLMKPADLAKPVYQPQVPKYAHAPYGSAVLRTSAKARLGGGAYDYAKGAGGGNKPSPKPPHAHGGTGTTLPKVHDLTSKFAAQQRQPPPAGKAAPTTFSAAAFNKFSFSSPGSGASKDSVAKSLGGEVTLTTNLLQPKPLDLAAIPKGITITNVRGGMAGGNKGTEGQ